MSQGLILENEDYPLLTGRRCTLQALADDGMAGVALLSASMSTAICGVSRGVYRASTCFAPASFSL